MSQKTLKNMKFVKHKNIMSNKIQKIMMIHLKITNRKWKNYRKTI